MKRKTTLFLAALAVVAAALAAGFLATSALAVEPAKPPAPPPTVPVVMTSAEVAVVGAALSNAGAACDQGVAVYCQIIGLRATIEPKLSAAAADLQKPAPTPEKKP